MSIKDNENKLFERWKINRINFIEDGLIDEESYLTSNPKLLFIMKEANDPENGNWDLRKVLFNGGRKYSWDNVTRWIIGIRKITEDINWNELENISNEKQIENLRTVCVFNLKKTPGGHTTNNKNLARVAIEDKAFINEQFSLYDADITICCGSIIGDLFGKIIDVQMPNTWEITSKGIYFKKYQNNKILISFAHPEARVQDSLLYYGLIDAVREITLGK